MIVYGLTSQKILGNVLFLMEEVVQTLLTWINFRFEWIHYFSLNSWYSEKEPKG